MSTNETILEGLERLEKLADHLLNGNRYHERFDFHQIYRNLRFEADGTEAYDGEFTCGTAGCALGEMPRAFPEEWLFRGDNMPVLITNTRRGEQIVSHDVWVDAEKFFHIGQSEAYHLFLHGSQEPQVYGGKIFDDDPSAADVAHNIMEFVKLKRLRLKMLKRTKT